MPARPRLKLRNLDVPQKLLVAVVVATILGGYLAALANLFAQHSEADGQATVKLEDFPRVLKEEGPLALVQKIERSLGIDDVVRHYHGGGEGTRLQNALDGSMKSMIEEKLVEDQGDKPETKAHAEKLRKTLVEWTKLPDAARKSAYEEGTAVDDDGVAILNPAKAAPKDELTTAVKDTLQDYCVRCHKPGGVDETAAKMPLQDYAQLSTYLTIDRGVSVKTLALTTHVHLLGFSVLFAMTGFLFSLTEFPWLVRFTFVPLTLAAQICEIACWWLAKVDVVFAKAIFYLGPVVAVGLLVQTLGILVDLVCRRPEPVAADASEIRRR